MLAKKSKVDPSLTLDNKLISPLPPTHKPNSFDYHKIASDPAQRIFPNHNS